MNGRRAFDPEPADETVRAPKRRSSARTPRRCAIFQAASAISEATFLAQRLGVRALLRRFQELPKLKVAQIVLVRWLHAAPWGSESPYLGG